jgi:hypothetical protein
MDFKAETPHFLFLNATAESEIRHLMCQNTIRDQWRANSIAY